MASQEFQGREKARFPVLLGAGLLVLVAVIVVALIVDTEFGIPLAILAVIVVLAAVGMRAVAGSNRSAESDASDTGLPKNPPPDSERPLGDTPEAHDEINPHDLPKSHPGRDQAEEEAGDTGTTRGPVM